MDFYWNLLFSRELVDVRREKCSSAAAEERYSREEVCRSGNEKDGGDNQKWIAAANLFLQQAAESHVSTNSAEQKLVLLLTLNIVLLQYKMKQYKISIFNNLDSVDFMTFDRCKKDILEFRVFYVGLWRRTLCMVSRIIFRFDSEGTLMLIHVN